MAVLNRYKIRVVLILVTTLCLLKLIHNSFNVPTSNIEETYDINESHSTNNNALDKDTHTLQEAGDSKLDVNELKQVNSHGIFQPQKYHNGDRVSILFDKIQSDSNPDLPKLPYYDLSFTCTSSNTEKSGSIQNNNNHAVYKSLMDIFSAKRLWQAPFDIEFGVDKDCAVLCDRESLIESLSDARQYIDEDYQYHWYIDADLPGATSLISDSQKQFYKAGFPVGYKEKMIQKKFDRFVYRLNTHFMFVIRYAKDNSQPTINYKDTSTVPLEDKTAYNIVGFEVYPKSTNSYVCPMSFKRYPTFDITEDHEENDVIHYTYSVYWREKKNFGWYERWNIFLSNEEIDGITVFSKSWSETFFLFEILFANFLVLCTVFYFKKLVTVKKDHSIVVNSIQGSVKVSKSLLWNFSTQIYYWMFAFGWQLFSLLITSIICYPLLYINHNVHYTAVGIVLLVLFAGSVQSTLTGIIVANDENSKIATNKSEQRDHSKGTFFDSILTCISFGVLIPVALLILSVIVGCIIYVVEDPKSEIFPSLNDFIYCYLILSFFISYFVSLGYEILIRNADRNKFFLFCNRVVQASNPCSYDDNQKTENELPTFKEKSEDSIVFDKNQKLTFIKQLTVFLLIGLFKFVLILVFIQTSLVSRHTSSSLEVTSANELIGKLFFQLLIMITINSSITALLTMLDWKSLKTSSTLNWKLVNILLTYSSFPFGLAYTIYYCIAVKEVTFSVTILNFVIFIGIILNLCFHSTLMLFSTLANFYLIHCFKKANTKPLPV